jgi:hypothetical protein
MRFDVELYIPNPLRCYNCQKFGHGKSTCSRKAVCAKCSQEGHTDTDCGNHQKCANCCGDHAAYSKECPTWIKQRTITQVKLENNISYHHARQLVEKQDTNGTNIAGTKRPGVSYAKAAATQTCIASTQTDLTWPLDSKIPVSCANVVPLKVQSNTSTQTVTETKQSTSAKSNAVAKGKAGQKPGPTSSKTLSNRSRKGANDPVGQLNKFGVLEDDYDDDVECEVIRPKSASPSTRKKKPKSQNNG